MGIKFACISVLNSDTDTAIKGVERIKSMLGDALEKAVFITPGADFDEVKIEGIETEFITIKDRRVVNIANPSNLPKIFVFLVGLLKRLKEERYSLHVNFTSETPAMMFGLIMASELLFDKDDRAWFVFPGRSKQGVRLIPIGLSYWNPVLPERAEYLDNVKLSEKFFDRVRELRNKREIKGFFEGELTKVERDVFRDFVIRDKTAGKIAKRLKKSRRTVENLIQKVYKKAKKWFSLDMKQKLSRDDLKRYFGDISRWRR